MTEPLVIAPTRNLDSVSRFGEDRACLGFRVGAMAGRTKEVHPHTHIVSGNLADSLITVGGTHMQTIPLSRQTVQEIEDVLEVIADAIADGVIAADEFAAIRREVSQAYASAMATDDAQAAGIAFMRNGGNSQRTQRLTRQWLDEHAA